MPNDPQITAARFVHRLALFYVALFVSIGIQMLFFRCGWKPKASTLA